MEEKLNEIKQLVEKHEAKKHEMLQVISAVELLEKQYKELETELYEIEGKYVKLMEELADKE
jgi:hypothetical protein